MGGDRFGQAAIPVAIMVLYPIHQTYGQLSGSVYYATGRTKLYRNVGIFIMLLGLITTYFLVAPAELMGLDLGSVGLAIKMVAVQFVQVNIYLWFNARFLGISFSNLLIRQFTSIATLGLPAWLAAVIADSLVIGFLGSFFTAGVIYAFFLMIIVYLFPSTFSSTRREIRDVLLFAKRKVSRKAVFNRHSNNNG